MASSAGKTARPYILMPSMGEPSPGESRQPEHAGDSCPEVVLTLNPSGRRNATAQARPVSIHVPSRIGSLPQGLVATSLSPFIAARDLLALLATSKDIKAAIETDPAVQTAFLEFFGKFAEADRLIGQVATSHARIPDIERRLAALAARSAVLSGWQQRLGDVAESANWPLVFGTSGAGIATTVLDVLKHWLDTEVPMECSAGVTALLGTALVALNACRMKLAVEVYLADSATSVVSRELLNISMEERNHQEQAWLARQDAPAVLDGLDQSRENARQSARK